MKIIIIDYGLGNLHSVLGAVQKLGFHAKITNNLSEIEKADKLILPGVGAFEDGIVNLRKSNLISCLDFLVNKKKKPILGICLGFQLLANDSNEFGFHEGLGWVNASVKKLNIKIEKKLRVPHVGWNNLLKQKKSVLWDDVPDDALFYYVHSYHMECYNEEIVIAKCNYGYEFVSAIQQDNIYGTQFHPEKSQFYGLKVLKNFIEKT